MVALITACGGSKGEPVAVSGDAGRESTLGAAGGATTARGVDQRIAAGADHACAVRRDGTVACWGNGIDGALGLATPDDQFAPVTVPGVVDAVGVSASRYATCVWRRGGAVTCWGSLGDHERTGPTEVEGVTEAVQVAAGATACAVRRDGTVVCWGHYAWGSKRDPAQRPFPVAGIRDAVGITIANERMCAQRRDGRIDCFDPWSKEPAREPLAGKAASAIAGPCAVSGGRVHCWSPAGATAIDRIDDAIAVSAWTSRESSLGPEHGCAVQRSGAVACWGNNLWGQLGDGAAVDREHAVEVDGLTDAVEVAAGEGFTCARRRGGNVACWGRRDVVGDGLSGRSPVPVAVPGVTAAVEIAAGWRVNCARDGGGAVKCWGDPNSWSSAGVTAKPMLVAGWTDVVDLIGGNPQVICARHRGGRVSCLEERWSRRSEGAPSSPQDAPELADAVEIFGTNSGLCHRPRRGAPLRCRQQDEAPPGNVLDASALWARFHDGGCALRKGRLWCWGDNENGVVGDGTTTTRTTAVAVAGLGRVVDFGSHGDVAVAVLADGGVAMWGDLGSGDPSRRQTTPRRIDGIDDAVEIAVNERSVTLSSACARRKTGAVICWDFQSTFREPMDLTATPVDGITDAVELAAGDQHHCARRRDGAVLCWGLRDLLGDGTGSQARTPVEVRDLIVD